MGSRVEGSLDRVAARAIVAIVGCGFRWVGGDVDEQFARWGAQVEVNATVWSFLRMRGAGMSMWRSSHKRTAFCTRTLIARCQVASA